MNIQKVQTVEQMQFLWFSSSKKLTDSSPQIASPFFAKAGKPSFFFHLQTCINLVAWLYSAWKYERLGDEEISWPQM